MTDDVAPPQPAPGWYPEPGNEAVLRYWNGSSWEEWRQPAFAPPVQPAPVAPRTPGNGNAIAALALGAVGLFFGLALFAAPAAQAVLGGIPAIIGGVLSLPAIAAANAGRGRAREAWGGFGFSLVALVAILAILFTRTGGIYG